MDPYPSFHNVSVSVSLLLRSLSEIKILATSCVTVGQGAIWVPPQCTRVISDNQLHQQALTCGAEMAWHLPLQTVPLKPSGMVWFCAS